MTFFLDLLAVISFILCVQTLIQLRRDWREFSDAQVSRKDQLLAQRIAIFLLLPLGVLLHELGHAIATWQVGGKVSSFQWRLTWGYIIPEGDFSALEHWWIALSGNLVSVLLVIGALLWIPRIRQRIWAEVLFFFACAQSITSLVAYPLLSLRAGWGDWPKIYDFSLQPQATLVFLAHVGLIVALWRLYHADQALHWRLARDSAVPSQWLALKSKTNKNPTDLAARLALVELLMQQNESREANRVMRALPPHQAHDPSVQLLQASLAATPREALRRCQPLLHADLQPEQQIRRDRILSYSYLKMGNLEAALRHADHGLSLDSDQPNLRATRANIHLRLKHYPEALSDLDVAIAHASTEDLRLHLLRWQKRIVRKASHPVQPWTLPQLLLVSMGFIPFLGLPFALGAILWGLFSWKRNGVKLVGLGLAGPVLSVIFTFGSITMLSSFLFPFPRQDLEKSILSSQLYRAAEMIEAYKRKEGTYPDTLKAMADSLDYMSIFDTTQAGQNDHGYSTQPTLYYRRLADPAGYDLFALGSDGKPFTPDDVRLAKSSSWPGLRQSARP
jgi:tetratricopeptide (TPR) repeat protein